MLAGGEDVQVADGSQISSPCGAVKPCEGRFFDGGLGADGYADQTEEISGDRLEDTE